jgi:putative CocE/NonD family hydrolase
MYVRQDVRGRYGSEGIFQHMTPHIDDKKSDTDVDESSDTYDTIEWLVNNIPNNNGRVGIMGISYPGFYSAAGMIDNHPCLTCASPQAPINDFFVGDDFHHNGAFYLPHAFGFLSSFGKDHPHPDGHPTRPTTPFGTLDRGSNDGYDFYLKAGPIKNLTAKMSENGPMAEGEDGQNNLWPDLIAHPDYDEFWQSRDIRRHLNNVNCAVLSVGGWYDAEDPLGPFSTFYETSARNPDNGEVTLCAGPWAHGQWSGGKGLTTHGNVSFYNKTEEYYREHIELPFLRRHLSTPGEDLPPPLPKAIIFEVGTNEWKRFDTWPPVEATPKTLHFHTGSGKLSFDAPAAEAAYDEYISDPAKPVPSQDEIAPGMTRAHMTDDQRFASSRTDVMVYETDVLTEDVTICGPFSANLLVSTSGTDSDFIVKLIDVYTGDFPNPQPNPKGLEMGGYQQLVRAEPFRGKYRNSFEHAEPFVPNEPSKIEFSLPDVCHCFRKGHKIMVHIQSSFFPIVDRNPQTFTNIFTCDEDAFQKATQRVHPGSCLEVLVL